MKPLLLRSDMTERVYVVTRYKTLDGGVIEAQEKFDVTDQFEALIDYALPDPKPNGHAWDCECMSCYLNSGA